MRLIIKELPDSKIYELELIYWPYKDSWHKVMEYICQNVPQSGSLLDLMCGPGYLLGQIALKRPDIKLHGFDIDRRYITYAKKQYPKINFELGDVLKWESDEKYDVVICTGSLHHVPYDDQPKVVKNMASVVKPDGFALISDTHVDDYSNEIERKTAAAKLDYEYLIATIKIGAPNSAIEPNIDILWNDVFMEEYKTSIKKRFPVYNEYFKSVENIKTWPKIESEYGDYISICKGVKSN